MSEKNTPQSAIDQTCGTCRFWQTPAGEFGNCRFMPPVVLTRSDAYFPHRTPTVDQVPAIVTVFPAIHKDHWCGKWASKDAQAEEVCFEIDPQVIRYVEYIGGKIGFVRLDQVRGIHPIPADDEFPQRIRIHTDRGSILATSIQRTCLSAVLAEMQAEAKADGDAKGLPGIETITEEPNVYNESPLTFYDDVDHAPKNNL